MFSLQVNGEVLWKWKDISGNPGTAFALIQRSLQPLGYQLEDALRDRVGHALASAIRKFRRKMESITNGKKRKSLRADSWIKVGIHPEEIRQSPTDVLAQLTKKKLQPSCYRGGEGSSFVLWPGFDSYASAVLCGLSLLLVLVLPREVFLRVECTPVFPSSQKPTLPNSNSTARTHILLPCCLQTGLGRISDFCDLRN